MVFTIVWWREERRKGGGKERDRGGREGAWRYTSIMRKDVMAFVNIWDRNEVQNHAIHYLYMYHRKKERKKRNDLGDKIIGWMKMQNYCPACMSSYTCMTWPVFQLMYCYLRAPYQTPEWPDLSLGTLAWPQSRPDLTLLLDCYWPVSIKGQSRNPHIIILLALKPIASIQPILLKGTAILFCKTSQACHFHGGNIISHH